MTRKPRIKAKTSAVEKASTEKGSARSRAKTLMNEARKRNRTPVNTQGEDVAKRMRSKMVNDAINSNASKKGTSSGNPPAKPSSGSKTMQGGNKPLATRGNTSPAPKAAPRVEKFMGNAQVVNESSKTLSGTVKSGMSKLIKGASTASLALTPSELGNSELTKYDAYTGGKDPKPSQRPSSVPKSPQKNLKRNSAPSPKGGKSMSQTMSGAKLGAPKGKMGSEMRRKEYDMRGWAYDETITGKAAPKPKASTAPKSNSNAAPIVSGKTLVQSGGGGAPVYETGKVTAPSVKTGTGGTTNMKTRTNYDDNIYGFANGGAVKGKYSRSVDNGGAVKGKYSRSVDKGVKCGSKAFMCGGKVKK
jgi:hypothetical protein